MEIRVLKLFAGIAALMFMAAGVVHAGTKNFKSSASGTTVDVPVDIDSDSCFLASNGATVCTDTSGYDNFAGSSSPGGGFTGQNVVESDFVTGTGTSCNVFGTVVPGFVSCTLAGSSEQGCEFQVTGGVGVTRDNSSGDLTISTLSETYCADLSSVPFNFAGSFNGTITGGTGKNTGATGTTTGTFHGQELTLDAAGHGMSWFEVSETGTITTPK